MYYDKILVDFTNQLEEVLVLKHNDTLLMADKGYSLCAKTLVLLRSQIEKNGFGSKKEEIKFFKYDKILPMQYLIYFTEVRSCELRLPKICAAQQKKYFKKHIEKINIFFGRNIDFLLYMEQDLTHFDKVYFTRKNVHNGLLVKSYPYFKDPVFNTSHDGIWARIRAMGLFAKYLRMKKRGLDEKGVSKPIRGKVNWTGPYTAFVELLYGCHSLGYFNNGNISIHQLFEEFSEFLDMKKGNYSRTYNEIKSRKTSRIKFFEEAGRSLLRKMQDEDKFEG